jgi:hypothetical protein
VTLLERLLPSQDIDALLGDIDEEARRRSPFWYWGQIVAAIVVGSYRAVRKHPFLAFRAVGVGLLTLVVVFAPAPRLLHVVRVMSEGAGYYVGPYWLTLPPNAFRYFPELVTVLGFAASGWTIARVNRAHGIAMLMPWALLVCALPLYAIVDVLTYHGRPITLTAPVVGGFLSSLSLPAWVVLGGILAAGRRNTDHRPATTDH